MAKLTPKYDRRKDGSKNTKGYLISLKKSDIAKLGWTHYTDLKIEIKENKIEIMEEKNMYKRYKVELWNSDYKMYDSNYQVDEEEDIAKLCELVKNPGNNSRARVTDNTDGSITYVD